MSLRSGSGSLFCSSRPGSNNGLRWLRTPQVPPRSSVHIVWPLRAQGKQRAQAASESPTLCPPEQYDKCRQISQEGLSWQSRPGELKVLHTADQLEILAEFRAQQMLLDDKEKALSRLRRKLQLRQASPEGRSLTSARLKADAAAANQQIRLRYEEAMTKVRKMQIDRDRKLGRLYSAAQAGEGRLSAGVSNICTFSRRVRDPEDVAAAKERLRAKLHRNQSLIQESMEVVRSLMRTRAYAEWRRMERLYQWQLRRSGIGALQRQLEQGLVEEGRMANCVGKRFEAACVGVVREALLPQAIAELRHAGEELPPESSVIILRNVAFRCSMPRFATGEMDFVVVRVSNSELPVAPGEVPVWSAEVLKIVECKTRPRDVSRDLISMQRALDYFTSTSIATPESQTFRRPFASALVQAPDGRWLRLTPDSFKRLRHSGAADIGHHLIYITREGALGPSHEGVVEPVDMAWTDSAFCNLISSRICRDFLQLASPRQEQQSDGALLKWAHMEQQEQFHFAELGQTMLRSLVRNRNLWVLRSGASGTSASPVQDAL